MRLANKVALVTGGSAGLGLAIAQRFAREGARVYITGRRADALEAAKASMDGDVTAITADATMTDDLDSVVETIRRDSGHLDVVVANAGRIERMDFADVTEEHFDRTFDLNARGTLFTVQTVLPLLTPGSSIVLLGSITAVKGDAGAGTYSAAKAAVRSFARTWAAEFGDRGLRVNVLSPGPIDTDIIDGQAEYFGEDPAALRASMSTLVPMGRLGRPEEIANGALFLASDESSFMTGAELCIDGGMAQV
ncbi:MULTISPECIES: SDR family NAD(P)-dependent oxidoreductase [Mycolicibacterium]|jgi:NAD(P)-dependent dehydrogenase (short-subunit alcohol dehydrogenase family)|uniref:Short-chain dehydrogenase/reductase SDR n=2 Tax=Mycolicibacterium TaxID=1866885 RepID=A0A378TAV4_9MYCO|nr:MULTISPECIES: glucose 1-dehydrogenase [Mycolicibacterium]MCV7183603.1 glucose 1-dehydrogenase [Mycolicibacterium murale]BBY88820.1 oxidoreductase [Mycolicibacterium tokaiense]GFG59866.1 oxidoreductase [Mycolicibacterium murale]STZ56656.1 short-chain dehydrogenase/reductase SDR [Mycolicibacterium tokaiense]